MDDHRELGDSRTETRLVARLCNLLVLSRREKARSPGQGDAIFREALGFIESVEVSFGWEFRTRVWDQAVVEADNRHRLVPAAEE